MKNRIGLLALTVLFTGCVMKQKIMDVAVVSMTHPNLPEGSKLQSVGPVTGEFCADSFNDKGSIGLFDEAIKKAQAQSNADFITTVSFFASGNCVSLEGNGEKIVSENEAPASLRRK